MAVVGIDLGTTFSVIATPQRFEGEYFETVRGVTVIKDHLKQRITPSVVAVDRRGNILVGLRAKARAGMQPEPIMFVKRSMGEAREFVLGDRRLRPEEASAEILRYLKGMAERQMGEEIEEAVITVPAYFTLLQKQKTKEAGEMAGLKVGEILQEPVAAALMYCYDDARDPLTIMTYDLGGGTFDVAILRKEQGVFDIRAFDGDRYLGGYDFDKRLAYWIVERLNEQGYQLEVDAGAPERRAALAKLLVLAEMAKIKLSAHEVYALVEPSTGIVDARGEPVMIDVEITREVLEGLIEEDIEQTIRLCRRAIAKARIDPQEIDEIVMVGGSSRIPMIPRRLKAELGRQPLLIDPDLCVGVGAAIMAQRLGRHIGLLKLGYLPEVTSSATIQVAGALEPTRKVPDVTGCTVVLARADGALPRRQRVNENMAFLFPQVPLAADTTNTFDLRVEGADGSEVLAHRFSIRQEADGPPVSTLAGPVFNVLAKPIFIMAVDGRQHTVAEAKTGLPCTCRVPAQTTDQAGEVHIPVYEDNYQIGEIVVESVPTDLPIGSQVDITLTLRTDFYIDGRAYIPAAGVEGQTTIKIEPMVIRGLADLREEYQKSDRQVTEALAQSDRGQAFALTPRLKAALAASQRLLYEERDPNLAKAQELLAEVETLIRQLGGWQPDPPPDEFERARQEIESRFLPALYARKPSADDGTYEGQLKAIVRMGERALADKDEVDWADANRRVNDLHDRIVSEWRRAVAPPEEPPVPRVVKMKLGLHLTQLRGEVRRKDRLPEFEEELQKCERALKKIDAGAPDAMIWLAGYYENLHQPLQARIVGSTPPKDVEVAIGRVKIADTS
jgi:molecular chaperone DnaK (HSP70)